MNTFNAVDYGFIIVFIFSMLIGLRRGLVKEVVSIVSWIAAIVIGIEFAVPLSAHFSGFTGSIQAGLSSAVSSTGVNVDTQSAVSMFAVGVSFFLLVVGTLIVGSIVSAILSTATALPGINLVNSVLGAAFGLAKGFLFNLIIIFLVQLTSIEQQPLWAQSVIVNAYQPSVVWLSSQIQPGMQNLRTRFGNTMGSFSS